MGAVAGCLAVGVVLLAPLLEEVAEVVLMSFLAGVDAFKTSLYFKGRCGVVLVVEVGALFAAAVAGGGGGGGGGRGGVAAAAVAGGGGGGGGVAAAAAAVLEDSWMRHSLARSFGREKIKLRFFGLPV